MKGEQNITLLMAVPAIYNILILKYDQLSQTDQTLFNDCFKQFRLTISGSAPLQTSTFHKWYDITGNYMLERYGMSEIGMAISNCAKLPTTRIPGSIGAPLPGVSVRLVADDGKEISEYEVPGEMQIKGKTVFKMFKTGDIAIKDSRNFYRIMGRNSTDIIKSGGYKLSSIEIESSILKHSNVKDVSVIALQDDILGQVPGAAIVLKDNISDDNVKSDIENFCHSEMAKYKVPKKFVYIDELPRNIDKYQMSKSMIEFRNLNVASVALM
ncbi:hypothetical protein BB561_004996 [Smittium simulii]|uniref:AMP-dependent synthetase/ligase domain-containing protein n=1 Tax=Smittium simulii TaxID=133385 RepID=A0A2T9YCX2_9FUNG|nr:hypothetical protein BB561_004996 [Smittium simulii]